MPTLRKWLLRDQEQGEAGLIGQSRRPKHSPQRKVFEQGETPILALRRERNFGASSIQQELRPQHQFHLGLEAIHKVLKRHHARPLRRPKRSQSPVRYRVALPGELVQLDTMKLVPGLYQYSLEDDCTCYLVAALYPRRKVANTLEFLEQVLDELPFPLQRLQTDNGTEFMAYLVRNHLLKRCIKHRPIPPGMPHLNVAAFDPIKEANYVDQLTLHHRKLKASEWRNDVSESHSLTISMASYSEVSRQSERYSYILTTATVCGIQAQQLKIPVESFSR